jgi:hypothetical protein
MATLFIAVWGDASQTLIGKPIQEITVAIGGTSAQSDAIVQGNNKAMRQIRIFSDTDCFVTWGDNPVAKNDGSDGRPMGAENPGTFGIESGWRIAVIERV